MTETNQTEVHEEAVELIGEHDDPEITSPNHPITQRHVESAANTTHIDEKYVHRYLNLVQSHHMRFGIDAYLETAAHNDDCEVVKETKYRGHIKDTAGHWDNMTSELKNDIPDRVEHLLGDLTEDELRRARRAAKLAHRLSFDNRTDSIRGEADAIVLLKP